MRNVTSRSFGALCLALFVFLSSTSAVTYEAESLPRSQSGATSGVISDGAASGGQWVVLHGDSVGDYLDLTISNVGAGDYDISYRYKSHSVRGNVQLSVSGFNVGGAINQSTSPDNQYRTANLGTFTFGVTGSKVMRFSVASSGNGGGEKISVDSITLTPAGSGGGTGFFEDEGKIATGRYHLPGILAVNSSTIMIIAQERIGTQSSHQDKGASHVTVLRNTNKGDGSWSKTRLYQTSGEFGDCGYGPVLVKSGSEVLALYTIGPRDWGVTDLVVHMRKSSNNGSSWGSQTTPSVSSSHDNGKPTNGGKGFTYSNGRICIPGRKCVLYSDNGGSSWTATSEWATHVETKLVMKRNPGETTLGLLQQRNQTGVSNSIRTVRLKSGTIAQLYNTTHNMNGSNNCGLARYDNSRLIRTAERGDKLYVATSTNEGVTWTNEKEIPIGSSDGVHYSEVDVMSDGTIVVVFMETVAAGDDLRVVRFDLDWLLN